MQYPRTALVASLWSGVLLLTSCMIPPDGSGDGLRLVQPRDIPVPAGMELQTYLHESHTHTVGDYRFAHLIYEGSVPVMQVAEYMLERMPKHSYRLVSQERKGPYHDYLVFQRGRYTSECTVRRLEHKTRMEVRVRTNVEP
jgi:hypothetical protein